MLAPNGVQWVVAALGALGAGAWLVPINTRFRAGEVEYVLAHAKVSYLLTVTDFLGVDYVDMLSHAAAPPSLHPMIITLDSAERDSATSWDAFLSNGMATDAGVARARIDAIGPDDVADVIFTSGTTARPKGVMLRHGASLRAYEAFNAAGCGRCRRPPGRDSALFPHLRLQGRLDARGARRCHGVPHNGV